MLLIRACGRGVLALVLAAGLAVAGCAGARAASALVLVALLLAINVVTTWIGHRWLHWRLLPV